jgi:hypothetical protein
MGLLPPCCPNVGEDAAAAGTRIDRATPAVDRPPAVTIRQPGRNTVAGMDETQTLAARALRELLDNPERDDWDELLAANRALLKAIATGRPMTPKNVRIVAEYLREAGWRERAIGAATKPGPDLESSGGTPAKSWNCEIVKSM